jgi:hypothetical protein
MAMEFKNDFPQYRKYNNNKSFFKIISEREFIEHKVIGKYYEHIHIIAKQYPEMVFIQDLLTLERPDFLVSDEEEFEGVKNTYRAFNL